MGDVGRRTFLRMLGLGAMSAALPGGVALATEEDLEPARRYWQVGEQLRSRDSVFTGSMYRHLKRSLDAASHDDHHADAFSYSNRMCNPVPPSREALSRMQERFMGPQPPFEPNRYVLPKAMADELLAAGAAAPGKTFAFLEDALADAGLSDIIIFPGHVEGG